MPSWLKTVRDGITGRNHKQGDSTTGHAKLQKHKRRGLFSRRSVSRGRRSSRGEDRGNDHPNPPTEDRPNPSEPPNTTIGEGTAKDTRSSGEMRPSSSSRPSTGLPPQNTQFGAEFGKKEASGQDKPESAKEQRSRSEGPREKPQGLLI